jgi:competence protein ComEA
VLSNLSRSQALVYGALAVALLLIGARAIRGEIGGGSAAASPNGFSLAGSSGTPASGAAPGSGGTPGSVQVGTGGPDVVVDVAGAVRRPGVYRLPVGARVTDAVERAGGASARAELEAINLAARLSDGQQVLVPERGAAGPVPGSESAEEGPISLGAATVEQLETIDGIGPVTAADIVRFRDQHGGLSSVDQLDQVSGIGPATMEALRARLQP